MNDMKYKIIVDSYIYALVCWKILPRRIIYLIDAV